LNPSSPPSVAPTHRAPAPWLFIVGYFLASRRSIFVIGIMSVHVILQGEAPRSMEPLDLFKNWDANWYLDIARSGYGSRENSPAFFPLYPLLLHLGGYLIPDLRVVGYLISNALLLASCFLLWKLIIRDYGDKNVADRAVIFFLFCPVSFFFSTIYTESLFFFLMLAVLYLGTERRWIAAGCCGFLAALTRPVGILLVVALAAEFAPVLWKHRKIADKSAPLLLQLPPSMPSFFASVLLTLSGLGVYALYLAHRFNNPFQFLEAEKHWNRHLAFPWVPFEHFNYLAFYVVWFYAAAVMAVVIFIFGLTFRLRASHSVLCATYLIIYLSTSQLEALPRFLSVLFPFYISIAMGAVKWPRLEPLFLAGSAMLLTLSIVLFVNGYWFT
jgi:Gpi18-like mannosyltransferase